MSGFELTLRRAVSGRVDARDIRLAELTRQSPESAARTELSVEGQPVPLGDLLTFKRLSGERPRLVLVGDFAAFDALAYDHDGGEFRIVGDVGHHAAAAMTGGRLIIEGDAGDFTAAPVGPRRTGMRGGRVVITGACGDHLAHRMRRGEVFVQGDCGRFVAAHQVAGTVVVAGRVGPHAAYGIRRGTLIVPSWPRRDDPRFSPPDTMRSTYPALLHRSLGDIGRLCPAVGDLIGRLAEGPAESVRGDAAVAGQAEILTPGRATLKAEPSPPASRGPESRRSLPPAD